MITSKILITGPPKCGKSTLVSKLIDFFSNKNYVIRGFTTPEIREKNNRIGFDIIDIYSGKKGKLARIGNYETKFKLGKYSIFIDEFEEIIKKSLENIIYNSQTAERVDLICLDEIGKMELFSEKFQTLITNLFQSNFPVIATIGQKVQHPVKDYILNLTGVVLFNLSRQNQQLIYDKIVALIS
jgi:nucleoside-triphosphatase